MNLPEALLDSAVPFSSHLRLCAQLLFLSDGSLSALDQTSHSATLCGAARHSEVCSLRKAIRVKAARELFLLEFNDGREKN